MKSLNEKELFYMETEEKKVEGMMVESSTIFQIVTKFSKFKRIQIYQDKSPKAEILNFGIDSQQKRLIILTGIKNQKNRRDKFFTIYDFENEQVVYSLKITDRVIIGRLKSNLYILTDGHIYFDNDVIKIRYD